MTIRARLLLLALVLVLGGGTVGIVAGLAFQAARVGGAADLERTSARTLVADLHPPAMNLLEAYEGVLRLVDEPNPDVRAGLLKRIIEQGGHFEQRLEHWRSTLPAGPLQEAIATRLAEPSAQFMSLVRDRLAPAVAASDRIAIRRLINGEVRTAYNQHAAAVAETADLAHARAQEIETEVDALVVSQGWTAAAVALVVGLVVAWWLHRLMRRLGDALDRTTTGLTAIAAGDLGVRLHLQGSDEFASLGRDVDGTVAALAGMVAQVHTSAGTLQELATGLVATSSRLDGLAAANRDASHQAASEADALSQAVGQIAAAAQGLAGAARDIAGGLQASAKLIAQAVDAGAATRTRITALEDAVAGIGDAVAEIAGIASQTRLLALNAAIEAASAGPAGRGFAVVANEVKELAAQTTRTTATIGRLVGDISGSTAAAAAGMADLAQAIAKVEEHHANMAAATEEQSAGTSTISEEIERIARRALVLAEAGRNGAAAAHGVGGEVEGLRAAAARSSDEVARLEQRVAGLRT